MVADRQAHEHGPSGRAPPQEAEDQEREVAAQEEPALDDVPRVDLGPTRDDQAADRARRRRRPALCH